MTKHKSKTWDKWYKKGMKWENAPPSFTITRFANRLKKGNKVLDLGCGSGREIIQLSKMGFDTYGIDFSKVAVEKAKKKYKAKNLHLSVNKAEKLPFKDNFFDGVYSAYVLNYTDMEKSVSEVYRVLKKKGVFYLVIPLRSKYLKTGKVDVITKEKDILNVIKKFNLHKKIRFNTQRLTGRSPRKNSVIRLILEK